MKLKEIFKSVEMPRSRVSTVSPSASVSAMASGSSVCAAEVRIREGVVERGARRISRFVSLLRLGTAGF